MAKQIEQLSLNIIELLREEGQQKLCGRQPVHLNERGGVSAEEPAAGTALQSGEWAHGVRHFGLDAVHCELAGISAGAADDACDTARQHLRNHRIQR